MTKIDPFSYEECAACAVQILDQMSNESLPWQQAQINVLAAQVWATLALAAVTEATSTTAAKSGKPARRCDFWVSERTFSDQVEQGLVCTLELGHRSEHYLTADPAQGYGKANLDGGEVT